MCVVFVSPQDVFKNGYPLDSFENCLSLCYEDAADGGRFLFCFVFEAAVKLQREGILHDLHTKNDLLAVEASRTQTYHSSVSE